MIHNEFIAKLTPSDIIQIVGILVSLLTALVAIIISLATMHQNSKMIEESSRAVISIYPQTINTGTPMLFMVIKNFGNSPAAIRKFDYNFDFTDCYQFRSDRDYLKDFVGSSLAPGQALLCSLDYTKLTRPVLLTFLCFSPTLVIQDTGIPEYLQKGDFYGYYKTLSSYSSIHISPKISFLPQAQEKVQSS